MQTLTPIFRQASNTARKMTFTLAKEFPDLVRDLTHLLRQTGETELADTVPALTIVERCR